MQENSLPLYIFQASCDIALQKHKQVDPVFILVF